jgi:hypothetical protein
MVLCSGYQQGQSSPAGTEDRQMTMYNVTAKTLDSMMAIWAAHTLPHGIRNAMAVAAAEDFAIKVCEAFDLPDHLIDEAVTLFQRRIPALGIAG